MAVSKTRAKLVDVARQLFAKNGVDDTTMNDIAVASKKGRRTLYTYFKSKEDIYMAVVESELEMLSGAMEKVAEQDIAPDTKILRLIETHLDSIKMVVFRNGTLRAGFFRDIWRVEAVRKNFDGSRKLMEISEITGMAASQVALHPLFEMNEDDELTMRSELCDQKKLKEYGQYEAYQKLMESFKARDQPVEI